MTLPTLPFHFLKKDGNIIIKKITSQATNHVQRLLLMLMFILMYFISNIARKNRLGFEIFYYFKLIFCFFK
jgi:hypothetical protein